MKFQNRRSDINVLLFQQFEVLVLSGESLGVCLHSDIKAKSMLTSLNHKISNEANKPVGDMDLREFIAVLRLELYKYRGYPYSEK